MTTQPEKTALTPLIKGRFSIFEAPDGGYHLTYLPDGTEEEQHVTIPGMYVRLARAQMGGKGGLKKITKGLFG